MKQAKLLIKIGLAVCVFVALLVFGFGKTALAQKNNLSYPIKELAFCRDAKECYLYCEIPENKAACWSYGKYKLYPQVLGEEDEAMEAEAKARGISFPIAELGNCASVSACREYCGNQDNYVACSEFAKKKGFSKDGSVEAQTKKAELIQKAKEELGCTSELGCRSYCELKENRDRCVQFAKKQGFGEKSLPCNSDETCRKYCQENPSECPGYNKQEQKSEESRGGAYTGPSGCRNEEECRKWCLDNPDKCPGYKQSGDYARDSLMNKTDSGPVLIRREEKD